MNILVKTYPQTEPHIWPVRAVLALAGIAGRAKETLRWRSEVWWRLDEYPGDALLEELRRAARAGHLHLAVCEEREGIWDCDASGRLEGDEIDINYLELPDGRLLAPLEVDDPIAACEHFQREVLQPYRELSAGREDLVEVLVAAINLALAVQRAVK